jgi:hypothetical protein
MSYPHYDLVTRAHSELLAEGLIGPRTDQTAVENDKGLICRRAAYHVYTERDATHGLMEKTSGNNSMGYSVDWILRSVDGVGWDITSDDGVNAFPVNGSEHPPDASYIPRWRQPTAELAQISSTPPEPDPPPEEVSDEELFEILENLEIQQANDTAAILARDDANTQRILDTIDSIKTQVEESLQKALALIVVHRRREDDPDGTGGVV